MTRLLAVDTGLKTGLALFNGKGRLVWYRSQHYPSAGLLKKAVYGIFKESPEISRLVIEGGGPLADIWIRQAAKHQVSILQISAETWRAKLLFQREQRTGSQAKIHADKLARAVIDWSGAKQPTSLQHDAAEAILAGFWAVIQAGWIEDLPRSFKRISQ